MFQATQTRNAFTPPLNSKRYETSHRFVQLLAKIFDLNRFRQIKIAPAKPLGAIYLMRLRRQIAIQSSAVHQRV